MLTKIFFAASFIVFMLRLPDFAPLTAPAEPIATLTETAPESLAPVVSITTPPVPPAPIVEPVREPELIGCGPHDPQVVLDILLEIGVPRLAAIQQLGSWQHESGGDFDQCQRDGDGGLAWGLNSWHPARRYDMPQDLRAQVTWAIHTEMKRDCLECYEQFMRAESVWSVRQAIARSTRWGFEGSRWDYADTLAARL